MIVWSEGGGAQYEVERGVESELKKGGREVKRRLG